MVRKAQAFFKKHFRLHGDLLILLAFKRPFIIRKYLNETADPKLHLGCGDQVVPGWLNVDRYNPNGDVYMNVKGRLPFPDNTFSKIFTDNMVEHIPTDHIPKLFEEIYRILKPGGIIRIVVPCLEKHARAYINKDKEFYDHSIVQWESRCSTPRGRRKHWLRRTPGGCFVAYIVRRFYHHRWMYDFETMESCLKEVGFSQVIHQEAKRSIDSELAEMDNDSPIRMMNCLHLDAVK